MKLLIKYIGSTILVVTSLTVFGWWQIDGPGKKQQNHTLPADLAKMDFLMTNHLGESVSPKQLLGKPVMVFFGFTYCPDICPNTLSEISAWIEALGKEADSIKAIFITVDPERDNVESVAEYLTNFSPHIEGWIGSKKQLADAGKFFNVRYKRISLDNSSYSVDHTSGVFLFRADGSFARTIDYHENKELALPKIRRTMSVEGQIN